MGVTYMVVKVTWISVLKGGPCVYEMHNYQIPTVPRHIFAYHFEYMICALILVNYYSNDCSICTVIQSLNHITLVSTRTYII